MSIINDSFMLKNETAKELYNAVKDLPIIDYHCHLQPAQIAENHRFKNAFDLFLSGDHYKWRQMRTFGIDEEYITGNAPDYEKFKAFGWDVIVIDGHDFEDIRKGFEFAKNSDKPTAIIAKTHKGMGVSFMKDNAGWHGKAPNDEQLAQALEEIGGAN